MGERESEAGRKAAGLRGGWRRPSAARCPGTGRRASPFRSLAFRAFFFLTCFFSRPAFEKNLFGLVAVTRAVLPHMRERRRGVIVNIGSISGRIGFPGLAPYSASKFVVEGFSESLRLEMRPFGAGGAHRARSVRWQGVERRDLAGIFSELVFDDKNVSAFLCYNGYTAGRCNEFTNGRGGYSLHVIVDDFGAFVGKTSERLVIRGGKEGVTREIPLFDVEAVLIVGRGVTLSADAIYACMERGAPIDFIDGRGMPYAKIMSPQLQGAVQTRRAQLEAYRDDRAVILSRAFVYGKLRQQSNLLKYWAKHRQRDRRLYEGLRQRAAEVDDQAERVLQVEGGNIEEVRGSIMALEAAGAKVYWDGVKEVLPPDLAFPGRRHQEAEDPVNRLLNYGYGVLQSQAARCLLLAGLDLHAGYLHADRSGRPSLVLDFMEEFRVSVVDRTVLGMVNKGYRPEVQDDGAFTLADRRRVADEVMGRLACKDRYAGKKFTLGTIMQEQARHVATFLRGERPYEPFIWSW